jgi:hypothetical protein
VADQDFVFALDLSDEPHFDRMLQDLAAVVLRYVGYDAAITAALTRDVRAALTAGAAEGRCDVRFGVSDRTLRIRVAFAGGHVREITHDLPPDL